MIPKTIHYCWFGRGEKPKLARKCIESWKKYCPDYELVEWNEDNFDVNMNGYTRMCYEQKKYAFLSDYVRLWVVWHRGGIYFDTDVELLNSPDQLLKNEAFFGFETDGISGNRLQEDGSDASLASGSVATGLGFGSIAEGVAVGMMLKEYDALLDGEHGVIGCPRLNTEALVKLGLRPDGSLQHFGWGTVYPKDFFNPLNNNTGKVEKTANTCSVHWYSMSWLDPWTRSRSKITRVFHRLFGEDCFRWLKM